MNKRRWILAMLLGVMMSLVFGMASFAAAWRNGEGSDQGRWWYDYEDGTYASDGWQWIDGNNDGEAECYYFDSEGWMAANETTPDGYQVDGNGAWISGGIVVRRSTGSNAADQETTGTNDQLIIYFSRTGTTENVARQIQSLTGADIVELEAEEPYPESYQETLSRAEREYDSNSRPAVRTTVDLDGYDTIFIGYPIWYGAAPRVILTFLESSDLSGKTIIPFATSGGSGIAVSVNEIRSSSAGANVLQGRLLNSTSGLEEWIAGLS